MILRSCTALYLELHARLVALRNCSNVIDNEQTMFIQKKKKKKKNYSLSCAVELRVYSVLSLNVQIASLENSRCNRQTIFCTLLFLKHLVHLNPY